MSSLVIDTHVAVWYTFDISKLSATALNAIRATRQEGNSIYLPSIAIVELVYLVEKNRLAAEVLSGLQQQLATPGSDLVLVPLDLAVAEATQQIPRADVPDMPDRIVAATALQMQLPLISRDGKIRLSQVTTIW